MAEHEVVRLRIQDLTRLAQALAGPADPKGLRETCPQLIELAEKADDTSAKAQGHHLLGLAHVRLGEFEKARKSYEAAVDLWLKAGDTDSELRSRQGLTNTLQLLGDPEEALAQAAYTAEAKQWFLRCSGLVSIGGIQEQLADYKASLEYIDRAEHVLLESDATPRQTAYLQSYIWGNRTNVQLARGDLSEALSAAQRMAVVADMADNRSQKLEALINLGLCRTRQGDLAEGWGYLTQAQQAASLGDDQLRDSTSNTALSEWACIAGLSDRAVTSATRGLELAESCKARFAELYACLRLAEAQVDAESLKLAAETTARAREAAASLNAPYYQALAGIIACRIAAHEDPQGQVQALESIVARAEELGSAPLRTEALVRLAECLLRADRPGDAAKAAEAAVTAASQTGARPMQWAARHVLGRAKLALGGPDAAMTWFRQAIKIIEEMWWPLWRVGFAQVTDVKPAILAVYFDLLRTATAERQTEEVNRVLAMSPWPFLRDRWEAQP